MAIKKIFSDERLLKKSQLYYLFVAGFTIRIVFEKSEQVIFKRTRIEQFLNVYEDSGFLIQEKDDMKIDFSIYWGSYIHEQMYDVGNNEERFFLIGKRCLKEKKYYLSMMSSLVYFQFVLKEVLNILLVKSNGFMMHGSGVFKEGALKLFLGHSGSGKTTTQRMLVDNGYEFFCDDVFLVRKLNENWMYSSPPFIEKEYLPDLKSTKKAKVFLVEKDKPVKVARQKSDAKLFSKMLELVWFVEEKISKNAMENISMYVKENKIYRLERNLNVKKLVGAMNEA